METGDLFRHTALGRGMAEVRQVLVADGPGAGGRLLEVRTPQGLAADIALDRGGDLLRLAFAGREIGWHAPTEAPTPWPDQEAEHGLGFLRGFDGFMVTCGLDHHGLPAETSAAGANYPHRRAFVHPLHGRISAARASILENRIDWAAGAIVVALVVRQAAVFGEVLELVRRYAFSLETPSIQVADEVTNRGFRPARHGVLYHLNVGHPLLGTDARLVGEDWLLRDKLDDGSASPHDDHVEVVDVAPSPRSGLIGLQNAGTTLSIAFDPKMLPATALWRAFQSGIFALGMEPQTDLADADTATLQAGESRAYALRIALESG